MKAISAAIVSTCALIALASGCTVGAPSEQDVAQEDVAYADQALCENKDGVNAVMTAIAVAAGNEMHRWLPYRDFQWNSGAGKLELSANAYPRCPNRACTNTLAMLAMQDAPPNTVKFPGGITLNSGALKSALKANWTRQQTSGAVQEPYDLIQTNWEFGSCDVKYFFNVHQQSQDASLVGRTPRITNTTALTSLNDNLIFLGYPQNKMLNFYLRNGQVSIDPTGGLNEGGTTTSGSCTAVCSKFSMSSLAGQCCSCNGVTRTFARSTFSSYMYLCQ